VPTLQACGVEFLFLPECNSVDLGVLFLGGAGQSSFILHSLARRPPLLYPPEQGDRIFCPQMLNGYWAASRIRNVQVPSEGQALVLGVFINPDSTTDHLHVV
jgi:hypothetical protein